MNEKGKRKPGRRKKQETSATAEEEDMVFRRSCSPYPVLIIPGSIFRQRRARRYGKGKSDKRERREKH